MSRLAPILVMLILLTNFTDTKTFDLESIPDPTLGESAISKGAYQIDWAEAIVKDGIRYVLGLNDPPSNHLPIIVQNISGETMENPRLRVVWTDDDSRMVDSGAWVYPHVLKPGEYGFAGATCDHASCRFPLDYGKLSVYLVTTHDEAMDNRAPINITRAEVSSSNRLSGRLINATQHDVEKIWLWWVCIERSGFIIKFDFAPINEVRVIRSGGNDEFIVNLTSDCADGYIVAAEGNARGT
jgi:hypothetical protein